MAFTLVELLIVIAIIAMLIAMILPALAAARESARMAQCLSNLRQMAIAAHQYAIENAGLFPIAYYSASNPPLAYGYSWDFTLVLNTATGVRTVQPGLLWRARSTDGRIQQCPSFTGRSNTLLDPYTGYNYNTSYVGHGDLEAVKRPAKVTDVRSPSTTALFGDGQWASGANKFMRSPRSHPGDTLSARHAGTQGFRHRGNRTNVAFADSHAESRSERFTAGNHNVAPGTGFLSDDNELYDLD